MIRLIQFLIRECHLTLTEIIVSPPAVWTGAGGGNPRRGRYPEGVLGNDNMVELWYKKQTMTSVNILQRFRNCLMTCNQAGIAIYNSF